MFVGGVAAVPGRPGGGRRAPRVPAAAAAVEARAPAQPPPRGSARVKTWAKVGSAAPALKTSREMRSMADPDVLLAVGHLRLAPEGVAAGGQEAVDGRR